MRRWRKTWAKHCEIDFKSFRSASLARVFMLSRDRKPHLCSLVNNLSKRCLSPMSVNHHEGKGYMIEPTVVALASRWT